MSPQNSLSRAEILDNCIKETGTKLDIPLYRGKVRDVYTLNDDTLGIVVSDRISAFDHIMKQPIPFKGQILNQLAAFGFSNVEDIVKTHVIDIPHPNVMIARACEPLPVEVVIRGYLAGHAWREYRDGKRTLSGAPMPEGMVQNQAFPEPLLTPATKAQEGHDEDISEDEILEQELVSPQIWAVVRAKAFDLFERGQQLANKQGLILVDTKYEFGLSNGEPILIDEVHTTDSSRYFYRDGYEDRLQKGEPQKQLSKEFLREWLMENGFQGKEGQQLPDLPDDFRLEVFERYRELYNTLTGKKFEPTPIENINSELEAVFAPYLEK